MPASSRSSATHLQQSGPLVHVSISRPRIEIEEARLIGLEVPDPIPVTALVDTGASVSVINPKIAETFRLRHTGFLKISAVGSTGTYPEYAASINFPGTDLVGFDLVRFVACNIAEQREYSCLLGRDILCRWKFTYDGRFGVFTIEE